MLTEISSIVIVWDFGLGLGVFFHSESPAVGGV